MRIKSCLVLLFWVAALALPAATAADRSAAHRDRIAASFVLALGRLPTSVETADWMKLETQPLAALLARHREQFQRDPAAQHAVVVKAWQDSFGRSPAEADLEAAANGGGTYTELLKRDVAWLASHPAEYAKVLHRAYRLRLQRDAYDLELDYWQPQGVLPYALLVACIDDWARRNQPGLMVTTGTPTASVNSRYLATVRLSPALGAEARAAAALSPSGDLALAIAAGRNLVAVGAQRITSSGAIHFVAAGAADLGPAQAR